MPDSKPQHPALRALSVAFPHTLPILAGFAFLGFAYGLYMSALGFSFLYPTLMALCIYGGSLEFVAAEMLLGIDFDEATVSPCYRYVIYTVGTTACPIDRTSGQPMHPYYECTIDAADLQVGDAFRITIKDGKVTEAVVPAALQVQRVTIASDGVTVLYGKDATNRMDNADFRVNGESVNWGSNSGGIDAEDVFSNYRFMKEYIPLDKLTTIEFVFKTNLD